MIELITIPFSEEESSLNFSLSEFTERGQPMAILNVIDDYFYLNSKIKYKFGLIDNQGKYFWFFYGKVVAKNRLDALKTYNVLLDYCFIKSIGKPFAFKDF